MSMFIIFDDILVQSSKIMFVIHGKRYTENMFCICAPFLFCSYSFRISIVVSSEVVKSGYISCNIFHVSSLSLMGPSNIEKTTSLIKQIKKTNTNCLSAESLSLTMTFGQVYDAQ